MAEGDRFLSRWSRRKTVAKSGAAAAEEPVTPPAAAIERSSPLAPSAPLPPAPLLPGTAAPAHVLAPTGAESAPLPTLEDVARLTHASDFSPYVARNVDAGVRNAAMKKLFSDPHFNVMDGLDTYIDDYNKADPIPLSMLRRMNQSAALGLFAEEADAGAAEVPLPASPAEASPDGAPSVEVAQSASPLASPAAPESRADDDPDLQLQPDDADRRAGAGPRPRG